MLSDMILCHHSLFAVICPFTKHTVQCCFQSEVVSTLGNAGWYFRFSTPCRASKMGSMGQTIINWADWTLFFTDLGLALPIDVGLSLPLMVSLSGSRPTSNYIFIYFMIQVVKNYTGLKSMLTKTNYAFICFMW